MLRETTSNKRIVFWNAAGSAVYALSSFLMLLIVIRLCGEVEGGIFSIGYAIAQLMLTVGVFESTTYFATDTSKKYTYAQYLAFKLITCSLMVITSIAYVSTFQFDTHKAAVAYALCAYRLFEAVAQFWFAAFQREERLDVGGFSSVWRCVVSMVLFASILFFTHNVVLGLVLATLSEAAWIACYDAPRLAKIVHVGPPDFSPKPLAQLFWACLPLFVSSFLAAYLNNVCKYAIETVGTESMQTVFNILFMPSFVINLFLLFFMRPSLTRLAKLWATRNVRSFAQIIIMLLLMTGGLTAGVIAACAFLGIPILEWFYAIDLIGQTEALLVVLLGGGFLSISNVFFNALVVIRSQHTVLIGYVLAIAIASTAATPLVLSYGVLGACVAYCISCLTLAICFAAIFLLSASNQLQKTR